MGGVIDPTSSVEPFYKRFYVGNREKIFSIGTGQVDSPFSSYAGLLGETGLIGLILYGSLYFGAYRRLRSYWSSFSSDPRIFPLITASTGFLVYTVTVSLYNPWLETGRMTTILWAMIAIVFQYAERLQHETEKTQGTGNRIPSPSFNRAKHRNAAALAR
jgi:hypothetical protein